MRAAAPHAIEAMLAELAHDIRTPLAGILALGELLAASAIGERERGWAMAIRSTAEHLALLTSLIVDAVRADAKGLVLRRDPIEPRRFAEAVAASLVARAETKGLTAEVAIADLPGRDRRRPATARGARKPEQRGEIHRARPRAVRGQSRKVARGRVRWVYHRRQRHQDHAR